MSVLSSLNQAKFVISFTFIMGFQKIFYTALSSRNYHTHLLMKTFCFHCTSRNFLLSTNSTSAVQCKILLKNPCRQNFYQNLFHLKYFINVNLKHFLEPHGPRSSTFFNPSFYIPELSTLNKKNLYDLLDAGILHSISNLSVDTWRHMAC